VITNDDSVVSGDTTADSVRVHVRSVVCAFTFTELLVVTRPAVLTGLFSDYSF